MAASQRNWRWCRKCQGLFFHGHPGTSRCPAGDAHDPTGSGRYTPFVEAPGYGAPQSGWRWCFKCCAMFYGANAGSVCPVDTEHDKSISLEYFMPTTAIPDQSQNQWRWCRRCQGMFYGGGSSSGVCPAGGAHSSEGSGNYVLPVNSGSGIEEVPYRIYTHLGSAFTLANTQQRVSPGFLILTQSKQWDKWAVVWRDYPSSFWLRNEHANAGGAYLRWPRRKNYVLTLEQPLDRDWFVCTADTTSPGWLALNNIDHNSVADVYQGRAAEGQIVVEWPWNGGHNQIWRMAPVG